MAENISVLMFDASYPPPVIGGKEKQAHLLSKSLMKRGVCVRALSYRHNGNRSGIYDDVVVQRVFPRLRSLPALITLLMRLRIQFRILHIHTPSRIGKMLAMIGWMLRYRVVFKLPNERLLDDLALVNRFVWKVLFRIVDLFVVLEDDTMKKLASQRVAKTKLFFVANGVEIKLLTKATSREPVIRLLFVGRLVPQKMCDQLIRACALLRDRGLSFLLTIVGDGPQKKNLYDLTKQLSLVELVRFVGLRPDVLSYMQRSDILVLPSEREGMSNVLLEAMSVGLPFIATDVGAVKQQVGDFGECFLCRASDPVCLAEKMMLLSEDPVLREEYGMYLHKRGLRLFSIDAVAAQYVERYRKLLG